MRLIDADALMPCIPAEEIASKMAVANAPTIEERKTGKWIPLGVRHGWVCSNCKKEDAYAFSLNEKCDYEMQDFFCPNCGADMRESHCDDCRFYDEECVYCPVKQERREK